MFAAMLHPRGERRLPCGGRVRAHRYVMRLGPLICMMFAAMPVAVAAGVLPEGDLVDGTSLVLDGTWLARNYAHEVDCRLNVPRGRTAGLPHQDRAK